MSQLEKDVGDNETLMEELTEQLKKLEEQAGEIMQTYQQAEVTAHTILFLLCFILLLFCIR